MHFTLLQKYNVSKKMPCQLLLNYTVFGEFVGTTEEMQLSLTGRLMKHQNTKNLCPSAILDVKSFFFFNNLLQVNNLSLKFFTFIKCGKTAHSAFLFKSNNEEKYLIHS